MEKKAPGSWNRRYELVSCRSTITVTANEINLISKGFAMIVRSASAENWLCFASSGCGVKIECRRKVL